MGSSPDYFYLNDDFFINLKAKLHFFSQADASKNSHRFMRVKDAKAFLPKRLSFPLKTKSTIPDIFSLLDHPEKILWRSRDDDFTFLVFGFMEKFQSIEVQKIQYDFKKNNLHDYRLYGSFLFENSKKVTSPWKGFRKHSWVFPWFELVSQQKKLKLNLYYQDHKKDEILRALEKWEGYQQKRKSSSKNHLPERKRPDLTYIPSKRSWISQVNKVKKLIQNKKLKKLVLARTLRLNIRSTDTSYLLHKLLSVFIKHYVFIYQTNPDNIFISFSPERLFKRKENILYTEAMAGSRDIKDIKDSYGVKSLKNITEHKIVEEEVTKTMKKITKRYNLQQRQETIRYTYIEHIKSTFSGILKNDLPDIELMQLLHPTSAVCGSPREISRKLIHHLEKFSRGLYASPIGYLSPQESELCVGIRSLLIKKKILLFSQELVL